MALYIVTIDGRAQDKIYTSLVPICHEYPCIPFYSLRDGIRKTGEGVYAKDGKLYRISKADIVRIKKPNSNNLPKVLPKE